MKNTLLSLATALAIALTTANLVAGEMSDKMASDKMTKSEMTKSEMMAPAALNLDEKGIAVQGYDVVAFFTESKPVMGSDKFTAQHEGGTYLFSSEKNRDTFAADPAKYAPQYGGYCAFGVTKDAKFPVEIETWQIVDGRLMLNKNPEVKAKFSEDLSGNVKLADEKWPTVSKS